MTPGKTGCSRPSERLSLAEQREQGHFRLRGLWGPGRKEIRCSLGTKTFSPPPSSWREAGRDVAIATVVETWGSAPRPVGSHLVIDGEGNFLGSVSGGCVEGAVVEEAADVIAKGAPRMLEFGVADETAWRVGLSCGGRIKVYVEKLV